MRALWAMPALLFTVLTLGGIITVFSSGGIINLLISATLGTAALYFWRKAVARL